MSAVSGGLQNLLARATGLGQFSANVRGFPNSYNGVFEARMQVDRATPCFGEKCGGSRCGMHIWHPRGSNMCAFRDVDIADSTRWQHMCIPCAYEQGVARRPAGR